MAAHKKTNKPQHVYIRKKRVNHEQKHRKNHEQNKKTRNSTSMYEQTMKTTPVKTQANDKKQLGKKTKPLKKTSKQKNTLEKTRA